VLLTGWSPRLQADSALPAHVDCVLSKPPLIADLRDALALLTVGAESPRNSKTAQS
jgi:hypothetical protein